MSVSFGGQDENRKKRGTGDFGEMVEFDEKNGSSQPEDLTGKRQTPSGGKAVVTFGAPGENMQQPDVSRTFSLRSIKSNRSKKSLRSYRSGNSDLSQSINEEHLDEKIKNIRVEHNQKIKDFTVKFDSISVMGKEVDFDAQPGGERIFTLAKKVPSVVRKSQEITTTKTDVDSFLDDDFGVNTI